MTPAVNINTVSVVNRERLQYYLGQPTISTLIPVTASRYVNVRPASGNSPIENGTRKSRAWDHRGQSGSYAGGSVIIRRNGIIPPNALYLETWLDGSFFSACLTQRESLTQPAYLESRASLQALESLKDQDFNAGVALAEAGKTADLLRNSAVAIAKSVRDFRRKRPKDYAKVKRTQTGPGRPRGEQIPAAWLEAQYGWTPLLKDIHGAASALGNDWNKNLVPVDGYAHDTEVRSTRIFGPYGSYVDQSTMIRHKCGVHLKYQLVEPELALLSSLGLTNPAEIVWEQMRYTFVIDWFLPIGQWLGALDATLGYQFFDGCKSAKSTAKVLLGSPVYKQPYGSQFSIYGGSLAAVNNYSEFFRTVYSSTPQPKLHFKSPVSASHIASGMSLLVQAFK